MKFFKYLALLAATTMFLAACQQSEDDGGSSTTTGGTLIVNVQDSVSGAAVTGDITVTQNGTTIDTANGVSTKSWSGLAAGAYSVSVDNADGYLDAGAQTVNIVEGGTTRYNAQMVSEDTVLGNVESVTFSFTDVDGNTFATATEENLTEKIATLVAAQTEEQVGVTVHVADDSGSALANIPVTVNITGDYNGAVAIYSGKPSPISNASANTFEGLVTNESGEAYFVLEATEASVSPGMSAQGLGNAVLGTAPAKIIVSAMGGNEEAPRAEFKAWFVNMSHLWYDGTTFSTDTAKLAGQRLGADFGTLTNIWDPEGSNEHTFATWAVPKQPNLGATPDQLPSSAFPGEVVYTLDDVSVDENGDPLVSWDASMCSEVSTDGTTCTETSGSDVSLVPAAGLTLEDLPISASVTATYVLEVDYKVGGSQEPYQFELKDYAFTKEWVGAFLTLDKSVANNVLTWYGPEHTLSATDTGYTGDDAVFATTYTVSVTNDSADQTVFNATVTDRLPAELGVIVDTDGVTVPDSNGGTYDDANHAITWDFDGTAALEEIGPGETVELAFSVYARQKPGFSWTDAGWNQNQRVSTLQPDDGSSSYADPYCVTNGFSTESLVVDAYLGDAFSDPNTLFEYRPEGDESNVCVVRPIFEIDKSFAEGFSGPVSSSDGVFYTITVSNVDRTGTGEAYEQLFADYPGEFDGTVRTNPYARGVTINDEWTTPNLDFTSADPFTSGAMTATVDTVGQDSVSWDAFGLFGHGTAWTADVNLQAQVSGTSVNNCAYLRAPQLNQPSSTDWQNETVSGSDTHVVNCQPVTIDAPANAAMTLTSGGEDDDGQPELRNIDDEGEYDPVNTGDAVWYKFTSTNFGGQDASQVTYTVSSTNVTVSPSEASVWYRTGSGQAWQSQPTENINSNQFVLTNPVPSEYEVRIAIPTEAGSAGSAELELELTSFDGGSIGEGETATEPTTIQ